MKKIFGKCVTAVVRMFLYTHTVLSGINLIDISGYL
jgi:hypothetical protein